MFFWLGTIAPPFQWPSFGKLVRSWDIPTQAAAAWHCGGAAVRTTQTAQEVGGRELCRNSWGRLAINKPLEIEYWKIQKSLKLGIWEITTYFCKLIWEQPQVLRDISWSWESQPFFCWSDIFDSQVCKLPGSTSIKTLKKRVLVLLGLPYELPNLTVEFCYVLLLGV